MLHSLDAGAQVDPEALKQAVVDKSYMCQLVDVQQQRGAVGGNTFVEILTEFKEPEYDGKLLRKLSIHVFSTI